MAAAAEPARQAGLVPDWYGFTLSFKGVLLEGLEVVFITLTFGGNAHDIPLAAIAAVSAVAVIAIAGFAVRAPLARVPENTMKFVVGVMLTTFGTFWGAGGGRRGGSPGRRLRAQPLRRPGLVADPGPARGAAAVSLWRAIRRR
jgi:uncharacterized membrane protein